MSKVLPGVIIVTHGDFGKRLMEAAFGIVGKKECCWAVSLTPREGKDSLGDRMAALLRDGQKFIILVDILGGTPSNVCSPYMKKDTIEVLTGVNLPLLIYLLNHREEQPFPSLVRDSLKTSRESISSLREKLNGHPSQEACL